MSGGQNFVERTIPTIHSYAGAPLTVQPMIVGKCALVVVDIQRGGAMTSERSGIPWMKGFERLVGNSEELVRVAHEGEIPVIFFQEIHRPNGVDFGRELDGTEGPHCIEGDESTELWPTLTPAPQDYFIAKRRYSGFYGTEFEILLRGLGVSTLVLVGALTDVCIHYTFADAHQRDFYCRVVEDAVLGSSESHHQAALNAMEYLQSGARRTTAEIVAAFSDVNKSGSNPRSPEKTEVA